MTKKIFSSIILLLTSAISCAQGTDGIDSNDEEASFAQSEQALFPIANSYYRTLYPGQTVEISFSASPETTTYIFLNSGGIGNWKFTAKYAVPLGADACLSNSTGAYTYWKENSDWNYWNGGGNVCWPVSLINSTFHSGSTNVKYKVQFDHYGSYPIGIIARFSAL